MSTRTSKMKARLFGKIACLTPYNRDFLIASLLALLYDAAPENTKDLIDRKIDDYGAGVKA